MLYPLLHRLERLGYVESAWHAAPSGRRRKHYLLSGDGRAVLAEQRRQWDGGQQGAARRCGCRHPIDATARRRPGGGMTMAERDSGLEEQIASWTEYLRRRRAVAGPGCRRARGSPARSGRRPRPGRLERGRGVLRRDQADRQPRRGLARVRPRALRPAVEAARDRRRAEPGAAAAPASCWSRGWRSAPRSRSRRRALFGITFSGDPEFYLINAGRADPAVPRGLLRVDTAGLDDRDHRRRRRIRDDRRHPQRLSVRSGRHDRLARHRPLARRPVAVVGVAYAGGLWRSDTVRMDFIRFTGEWFVYFTLLAPGRGGAGGVDDGRVRCNRTGCRRGRGGVDHPVRRRRRGDRRRRASSRRSRASSRTSRRC